jgi:diguanylate cyclase (GGDEF)-like protein/PAS domain S-box-containing protein
MFRTTHPDTDRWHRHGAALAVAVLLALMWGLLLWFAGLQQRRLLDESQRALDLVNRALSEQTAAVLRDAEHDLHFLEAWIAARAPAEPLADAALGALLHHAETDRGHLVTLRLLTRGGEVVSAAPTAADEPPQLVRQRWTAGGAIALHAGAGAAQLGAPQEDTLGRFSMPIVLRLRQPVGEVEAVLALVDLDRMMALHESLRLRPAGSVAMVRSDGVLMSRVPPMPGLIGTNVVERVPGAQRLLAQPAGTDIATSGVPGDEVLRLRAYRRLAEYPVSMVVTQGYDDAMESYYERRSLAAVIAAGISLAIVALTSVLLHAQRRARTRQAELAAVSDASPIGMFRAATDGRMTYVNEAYLRIQGLDASEAADGWLRLLRPDVREHVWADWRRVVNARAPFSAERWLRLPGGRSVLVAVQSNPVVVDGRVVGHVGTVKDITEQARAEKALRTLAAIFDTTTDFVVQADREGRMTYLNPAARQRTGIAADVPVDHLSIANMAPPETVRRYREEIVPQAVAHGVWIGETMQWDAQRREFPCSHILIAHKDAEGRLDYFSTIMRDISADKASREAAQRSEATMRSVADSLPAIVAVVDCEQRYRYANAAFEEWRGLPRDAVVGRTLREVLGEEEYEATHGAIERALAGEAVVFERTSDAGATRRHLHMSYLPLRLADGTLDGFIGVAQDITEHKVEQARLLELTRLDPLTGALNRAGFDHALDDRVRRPAAGQLALLCIDLDHFKAVNDRHGHPVGDELLKLFVRRLRNAVRPTDAVARLGGDEFAVLLDNLRESANAEQVAEKVLAAAQAPFRIDALEVQVGASIGIAVRHGSENGAALVERADGMLYLAKQAGRGRYRAEARGAPQG